MTYTMQKNCKVCGRRFVGVQSAKYCGDGCRKESERLRKREQQRRNYKHAQPKPHTCRRCGAVFLAKYRPCYCDDCLHDGTSYMQKLLGNRAEGDGLTVLEWNMRKLAREG